MANISYDQTVKADAGKLRLNLLPTEAIRALGEVLTYGADKYGPCSWRDVEPERYEAALLRHLLCWKEGELCDPESGLHHLKHVLCNAAFLVALRGQGQERKETSPVKAEVEKFLSDACKTAQIGIDTQSPVILRPDGMGWIKNENYEHLDKKENVSYAVNTDCNNEFRVVDYTGALENR